MTLVSSMRSDSRRDCELPEWGSTRIAKRPKVSALWNLIKYVMPPQTFDLASIPIPRSAFAFLINMAGIVVSSHGKGAFGGLWLNKMVKK